jgi:hypothetical protein
MNKKELFCDDIKDIIAGWRVKMRFFSHLKEFLRPNEVIKLPR